MKINCWLQNRDLLTTTKGMVEQLMQADEVGEIIIVDCDSAYQPLLEWYRSLRDVRVIREKNLGNRAVWKHCRDGFPYFVSDSDLDLTGVPKDFLVRLRQKLWKEDRIIKAGLALRIDDLPDHYPHKADVIHWESQFWQDGKEWHHAEIDTTAAMYRGGHKFTGFGPALRLGGEYAAKHVLWYLDPEKLPEDWRFYLRRLQHGASLGWSPRLKLHCHL